MDGLFWIDLQVASTVLVLVVALAVVLEFALKLKQRKNKHGSGLLLGNLGFEVEDKSILIVMGSGGHTAEMCNLLKQCKDWLNDWKVFRRYVVANSDGFSIAKIRELEVGLGEKGPSNDNNRNDKLRRRNVQKKNGLERKSDPKDTLRSNNYVVEYIPRSREVHSKLLTAVVNTLWAIVVSLKIIINKYTIPNIVICNGPGTCISICFWIFIIQLFWPFVFIIRVFLSVACHPIKTYNYGFLKTLKKLWSKPKIIFVESLTRVNELSLTGKLLYFVADRFIVQWKTLYEEFKLTEYHGILV